MLIKLYLQTENYMQQICEQQEQIELQNSIIAKLNSQLAALNANRGMYSSLHIISFYAVLHWWIVLTLWLQLSQYTSYKALSCFSVNVRVNANVPFQNLFIKCNASVSSSRNGEIFFRCRTCSHWTKKKKLWKYGFKSFTRLKHVAY